MSRKGFTLIELLVVIAIIGILSTVVFAAVNIARERGRIGAGKQFAAQVDRAAGDMLVDQFDFDDCAGTTASDSSGNGHTGTLISGPAWSTDTPSGTDCSLLFHHLSDYVTFPAVTLTDNFTISFWNKTNSYTTVGGVSGGMPIGGADTSAGYLWERNSSELQVSNDGETKIARIPYRTAPGLTWKQITVVVENGKVTVYKDGTFQGSQTFATPYAMTVSKIGSAYNLGTYSYSGLIDNVHLFTKSLTADEVGALYAAEAPSHQLVRE